jgi:hypothetical protein
MARDRLRVLVSGMIAGDPYQGGATWAVLQYLLGFRRLGCDVHFVEPVRATSLQPPGSSLGSSTNAAYFREVVGQFGLQGAATLLLDGTRETVGTTYERLRDITRRADLLINISGMLTDGDLLTSVPTRVYLDLDPAFVQMWHAVEAIDMRFSGHTHFATVGSRIGLPECAVPTCGLQWIHTLPPVVLDEWPRADGIEREAFTSVANWRGYGSIDRDGVLYGQKAHSLRRFFDVPEVIGERLELALAIHPHEKPDLEALARHGWGLVDPRAVAGTPSRYRAFIQGSRAEFGIAKSGYVVSRCGWFSDRSACYLASGRPVVAQETGFSEVLPTGDGLFAFESSDDVRAATRAVRGNYAHHAAAARQIAEAYLDSDRVLARLLDEVGRTRASAA